MLAIGNKGCCKNTGSSGGDGGGGTVIYNIFNFTGTVINGNVTNNFTVTGGTLIVNNNSVVIGGGLFLTNNYDYSVTNVNEITLNQPVYNTNITIINNYGGDFDINTLIKGEYPNDDIARANGVTSGQLYRMSILNESGTRRNVIVFLP